MPEERGIIKRKKKKKDRDKKNPFHFPNLNTYAFENLVHNIMWRVGRNFGFQAFNINPQTKNRVRLHVPLPINRRAEDGAGKLSCEPRNAWSPTEPSRLLRASQGYNAEWTPATIFVAGDHLTQVSSWGRSLATHACGPESGRERVARRGRDSAVACGGAQVLVKNYFIRRDKTEDERQEERFAKAVFELHTTIFYSYEEYWTHMHGLSIRPQAMQVRQRNAWRGEPAVVSLTSSRGQRSQAVSCSGAAVQSVRWTALVQLRRRTAVQQGSSAAQQWAPLCSWLTCSTGNAAGVSCAGMEWRPLRHGRMLPASHPPPPRPLFFGGEQRRRQSEGGMRGEAVISSRSVITLS
jgi:hypothetical protein